MPDGVEYSSRYKKKEVDEEETGDTLVCGDRDARVAGYRVGADHSTRSKCGGSPEL